MSTPEARDRASSSDVTAILADLQTQVDALARAVAAQQQVLDRLLADREQAKG